MNAILPELEADDTAGRLDEAAHAVARIAAQHADASIAMRAVPSKRSRRCARAAC